MSEWSRVTPEYLCPICKKPDNCSILKKPEGLLVYCGRSGDGMTYQNKQNAGGQFLHWLPDDGCIDRTYYAPPARPKRKKSAVNWGERVTYHEQYADAQVRQLAEQLGVGVESLHRLRVGWSRIEQAWTFPERDASGAYIGINRRFITTGEKKRWSGSSSGLAYANDWDTGNGPILLVEGGSDTAALMTMGLSVIGRPSNLGGVALLTEMLANIDANRPIIVIGERDRKPHETLSPAVRKHHKPDCEGCAKCWPGWHGATSTAQQLADKLGRPMEWAFPPDDAKDSRAWLVAHRAAGPPVELGQQFVAQLRCETIQPDIPEMIPPDDRPRILLDEWREGMLKAKLESIGKPGVYIDRSSTGAGKSFSDIAAAKKTLEVGGRSLIVLPTHENCREMIREIGMGPGWAMEYVPRLTASDNDHYPQNCWNDQADAAEAMGLPVAAAVCRTCQYSEKCKKPGGFLRLHSETHDAVVVLCTHARAAHQGFEAVAADGRTFISVHEDAEDMLRPTASVAGADVLAAQAVLHQMTNDPRRLNWYSEATSVDAEGNVVPDTAKAERRDALYHWSLHMAHIVDLLTEAMIAARGNTMFVPPATMETPAGAESLLFYASKDSRIKFTTPTWGPLLAVASGKAFSATIQVSGHDADNSQPDTDEVLSCKSLFVVRHNPPPADATTWLSDATASVDALRAILGEESATIIDATPAGRLERVKRAVQVPTDTTMQTSAKVVAGIVRAVMAVHGDYSRWGVICHRPHVETLQNLEERFAGRIAKIAYFGSGSERASNDWHRECDAILILGTPRLPPVAIEKCLLQRGNIAATLRPPGWGKRRWQGVTESGLPYVVTGRWYADEAWRAAHADMVRAALVQAVGRGRGILAEGVPVWVVSTEECGLSIVERPKLYAPLFAAEAETLAALEKLSDLNLTDRSPNISIIGKWSDKKWSDGLPVISTAAVAKETGRCDRVARRFLGTLAERGLVRQIGERGGWMLASCSPPVCDTSAAVTPMPTAESFSVTNDGQSAGISVTLSE